MLRFPSSEGKRGKKRKSIVFSRKMAKKLCKREKCGEVGFFRQKADFSREKTAFFDKGFSTILTVRGVENNPFEVSQKCDASAFCSILVFQNSPSILLITIIR
jgi:hypothetical protein